MVVIIGAGITGLALAHELAGRGVEYVVLEADGRAGGVIRTVEVDGRLLELGPQRARLTPAVRALAASLGIEDDVVTAPPGLPLLVYRDGRLRRVPFSLREALATDLISWPGKLRILLEPFTAGERPDESVARFLTRKFGREAYASMLGPLYGGLYASDPADMLMRCSLSRALESFGIRGSLLLALARRRRGRGRAARQGGGEAAPACSFRNGLGALIDALLDAHRERVRLGCPARSLRLLDGRRAPNTVEGHAPSAVERDAPGTVERDAAGTVEGHGPSAVERPTPGTATVQRHAPGTVERNGDASGGMRGAGTDARYVVETDAGDVVADDVVLTVPADAAARLLCDIAPDAAARIDRLVYNPLAVVHLDAECDVPALGYQVAFGERLETRGVTFNAHLFGRRGVYTAYLGGAKSPGVVGLPDDRLGALAAREFERATGRPARPIHVARVRMPAWDRSWTALDDLALPPGVHLAANYESRAGIPGRLARAARLAEQLAGRPAERHEGRPAAPFARTPRPEHSRP